MEGSFVLQGWAAGLLGVAQLFFIVNLVLSLRRGQDRRRQSLARDDARVDDDVAAAARQLRGDADRPSRPVRLQPARIVRRLRAAESAGDSVHDDPRADTGVSNVTLGIWLFLASEVMLFGALFSSYALLRVSAPSWPSGAGVLSLPLGITNTMVLFLMTAAAWQARSAPWPRARMLLADQQRAGAGVPGRQGDSNTPARSGRDSCRPSTRSSRSTSR